ncbi:MAG: hypothetical protein A07HR60_02246 [uncultured archaeon A07HR60]|jgi:hypothetical protein|nr:MAG: hypothetical protein A07HR60_02246 [uncultured archaeon A07HR60]
MAQPALLLTWLDAREVSATLTLTLTLSARAGNSERIRKNPTPSFEGRNCLSEPARSQPQSSGVLDN